MGLKWCLMGLRFLSGSKVPNGPSMPNGPKVYLNELRVPK